MIRNTNNAQTDPDIKYVLFLGCYRDKDVDRNHPLTTKLREIQKHRTILTKVKLGQIEKECITSLISEALYLPPKLCLPLSNVCHGKTGGIILFVVQFLKLLNEEGLLWFSLSSRRWEFDMTRIKSRSVSENVVQFMAQKMKLLPESVQMGLKLSSCLGKDFDADTLEMMKKDENEFDVTSFLKTAIENGVFQQLTPVKYAWVHDQVQQAAYELIPVNKRETFHLILGSRIYMKTPVQDLDKVLFLVADHMNRGLRKIKQRFQKYEVARLNLRAGRKAIALASFLSAASYLKNGISLLCKDSWETVSGCPSF